MIPTISSTDGTYCGASCTSSYNPPISNQCTQSMQSQDMYAMPMVQQNNNAHSGHYMAESSHMIMPSDNNYADPHMFHNNEYSPESSYSENSDYTTGSEEFENENAEKTDNSPASAVVVNAHEMYQQQQPHQSTYAPNGQSMMHAMSVNSCVSSNTLPPFPSINSNCDLSIGGRYKEGHCHSYQDPIAANSMHLNHYNSYSAMTDGGNGRHLTTGQILIDDHGLQQQQQQQPLPAPSQHSSLYSYDIHSSSAHYYSNGFHKDEPNFASPMGTDNVAVATNSHLTVESSSPIHQQQVNSSTQMVDSESNNIAPPLPPQQPQQQYIDLSLSFASSSSAESLLSAANTSDEDSRLTPVSTFTHSPLSSSSNFYTVVTNSPNLSHCPSSYHESYSAKDDHHLLPQCSVVSDPFVDELNEADPKSSSSSSDSSSESNLSSSDNFGEIIKKSIVETVSA